MTQYLMSVWHREGGIEVRRLHHPEATELLLGLTEGSVGHHHIGAPAVDDRRGARFVQAAGEDPRPALLEVRVEGVGGGIRLLHLRLRGGGVALAVALGNIIIPIAVLSGVVS